MFMTGMRWKDHLKLMKRMNRGYDPDGFKGHLADLDAKIAALKLWVRPVGSSKLWVGPGGRGSVTLDPIPGCRLGPTPCL